MRDALRALWSVLLVLLLLGLWPGVVSAQTTVVNPTGVSFDDLDYALLDNGQPIVTGYVLELWSPGADTTQSIPVTVSPVIPKAQATPFPGGPATRRQILIQNWAMTVPQGPLFVMTVKSVGSAGGSARSAASNPFSVPIPVRAPRAVTGVVVEGPKS